MVRWARHAGTIDFCPALAVLVCPGCSSLPSTKYYLPHRTLFYFISPHCPATRARQSCWVACLCVSGHTQAFYHKGGEGLLTGIVHAASCSRYQELAKHIRTDKHILKGRYLERTLNLFQRCTATKRNITQRKCHLKVLSSEMAQDKSGFI